MPIQIQTGSDATGLAQRFGLVGRLGLQLDEIVVPVAIVDDGDPLSRFDTRPAGVSVSFTPAAGQAANVAITPPGDGTIVIVDRIINHDNANFVRIIPQDLVGGTIIATGEWRDGRIQGNPATGIRGFSTAVPFPDTPVLVLNPGSDEVFPLDLTLDPAPQLGGGLNSLHLSSPAVDVAIDVSILWRELVARPVQ